jgi:predicted dehydrogenase
MQTQVNHDNQSNAPRVGIVGTGKIICESVDALRQTGWSVDAIWGRDPQKADVLATELGIPKVYLSYDEMLSSGVDFIYIGLANQVHYSYAMRALEAGVNVLLEKPFCSTVEQAAALVAKAKQRGLYLFETISNIYLPTWTLVRELLPKIGTVKLFQADFSQYSSRYDDYLSGVVGSAFDPQKEGGALRDLNIYNIHLAVSLFGVPDEVVYRSTRGYNGIDTSGVALLVYPTHLAVCTAAKDSNNPSRVVIQGENGYIYIGGMPNLLSSVEIALHGCKPELYTPNRYDHRLYHQFERFREVFTTRDFEAMNQALDHTLEVMKVLDMTAR